MSFATKVPPSGLPIDDVLPELAAVLDQNSNAVLVAPPGSGKTTVVPLHLIQQTWCTGKILMLEPRRLATRAAAQRMADTLGERIGHHVGYRMRGDSRAGSHIEVITEGVLTRMVHNDPTLEGLSAVIFDEFHERNLHGDVGLAFALDIQANLRPEVRLVVMSATLDGAAVAEVLGTALAPTPVVVGTGRTYPVTVQYAPPQRPNEPWHVTVAKLVERAAIDHPVGDVLVFCPGSPEIHRVAHELTNLPPGVQVHQLFGTQNRQAQDAALAISAPGNRKVILATAVAETSLTMPGIRVVIDGGLSRVGAFDQQRGMNRLDTVRVTQATADQRAGRAGRTAPGVCYRVWTAGDRLVAAPQPEIANADLTGLAIDLARWGAHDPGTLRWLTPPPIAAIGSARKLLEALDALDPEHKLTSHGLAIAESGIHPRLAHMKLRAGELGHGTIAQQIADVLDGSVKSALNDLPNDPATGICIALAYPERVAKIRDGSAHRYLLRNGTAAELGPDADHRGATFLAIAEVTFAAAGQGSNVGRIYQCSPINQTDLVALTATHIESVTVVEWDKAANDVNAQTSAMLGAIELDSSPAQNVNCIGAVIDGVRLNGIDFLSWTTSDQAWRDRVNFLRHAVDSTLPDVSDEALLATLEMWLAPHLAKVHNRAQLQRLNPGQLLKANLDWATSNRIDQLAPQTITVPSGNVKDIDYSSGRPTVSVKLQEMFGLAATPRIANSTIPITLHLLSPAQRPLAVTADLASFWAGPYLEIRKELRGRYPRHPWPDDPITAVASARVKPRN